MTELRDEERSLGLDIKELLAILDKALSGAEEVVRAIAPATLADPRYLSGARCGDLPRVAESDQRNTP
jgi:hypothetical protein